MIDELVRLLQQNLEAQERANGELLEVARLKQLHLTHNDVPALQQDILREEPLMNRIGKLESDRMELHRQCCRSLGLPGDVKDLEGLLAFLPQPLADALRACRERMRPTIAALREVNSLNVALISTSLEILEATLQALFGIEPPAAAYDARGARVMAMQTSSSFSATV